jgi:tetratricopeptide (TPR) repeat protein
MNHLLRNTFCILIHFSTVIYSLGQQADWKKVDSMKVLLPKTSGLEKYPLYYGMAYELFDVDNSKAVLYADSAYSLIKSTPDSTEMVKAGRLYGQLLRRVDRLDDAIHQFERLLPIAHRYHILKEEKFISNALAVAYSFKPRFDRALQYNFESLQLRQEGGDKNEISYSLSNIGLVYYKVGNSDRALQFYNQALKIKEDAKMTEFMDELLINISLCYSSIGDFAKAEEFIKKAFVQCGDHCNDHTQIIMEGSLGILYSKWGKMEQAIEHLNKSVEIANRLNDKRYLAEGMWGLGNIAFSKKDYTSALSKWSKAELLASNSGYDQILMKIYLSFSDLFAEINNCSKASFYQARYIQTRARLYNDEVIKNMLQLQIEYEERENLRMIKTLDENLVLKDAVIENQKRQQLFSIMIVILLLIIGGLLFRMNRIRLRTNKELDQKVKIRTQELVDGQSKLQSLINDQSRFIEQVRIDLLSFAAGFNGLSHLIQIESKLNSESNYSKEYQGLKGKLNRVISQLKPVG